MGGSRSFARLRMHAAISRLHMHLRKINRTIPAFERHRDGPGSDAPALMVTGRSDRVPGDLGAEHMVKKHGQDGGPQRAGEEREAAGDGFDGDSEDDDVLLDVEEVHPEWSEWLPWVDYVRTVREAKAGALVARRMLRGVRGTGSRARITALSTRSGEPVTRVDLHPDAWRQLEEMRADGARYRRLLAQGAIKTNKTRKLGRAFRDRCMDMAPVVLGVQMKTGTQSES